MNIDLFEDFTDGWSVDKNISKEILGLLPKKDHQLSFQKEKRRGKIITLVGKFFIEESEKKLLLKQLKKRLSCGGKINNNYLELQGDHKEAIKTFLLTLEWKFK